MRNYVKSCGIVACFFDDEDSEERDRALRIAQSSKNASVFRRPGEPSWGDIAEVGEGPDNYFEVPPRKDRVWFCGAILSSVSRAFYVAARLAAGRAVLIRVPVEFSGPWSVLTPVYPTVESLNIAVSHERD